MKILNLLETTLLEQTVRLTDLYDDDELNDESEELYHFLSDDDLDIDFEVHTMTPEEAKTYTTARDDMTVFQSFKDHATKDQKAIVKSKISRYDTSRIIVTMNKTVLDGNHQLIAGIMANKPIKYINLADQ
jgi:hypothetical protein